MPPKWSKGKKEVLKPKRAHGPPKIWLPLTTSFFVCLIEGQLFYRIFLFSVNPLHQPATGAHVYLLYDASGPGAWNP